MILSQGYFLRNGPDLRHEPLVEDVHWFDGDGYVHWVRLHGGEGEREGEGEGRRSGLEAGSFVIYKMKTALASGMVLATALMLSPEHALAAADETFALKCAGTLVKS